MPLPLAARGLRATPFAQALGLLLFIVALFFLRDGLWPASTVYLWAAAALAIVTWPFARRADIQLSALAPYLLYLLIVVIAWRRTANERGLTDPASTAELIRQLAFVATIWATAWVTMRTGARAWTAAILICLSLVVAQILGPSSEVDLHGRATVYSAIEQWSGYPEIGLLAGLGAAGAAALALGGRGLALRLAGAALACGFVGATVYLYSRSAIVTAVAVVAWVGLARLLRWRWRIGVGLLLLLALAAGWLAAGPGEWPARARAAFAARLQSEATDIRAEGWRVATEMRRSAPWFGIGPGRYPIDYNKYSARHDATHAYNIVLHTGAELGWLGLAAYLLLWARVLWISFAAAADRGAEGVSALAVHGMLVAFFARSQSEHFLANLTTSVRLLLLLAVLFGLAEGARAWRRRSAAGEDDVSAR